MCSNHQGETFGRANAATRDSPDNNNAAEPLLLEPGTLPGAPKRGLRWVFVGENGIRAGWGLLLFVIIFFAVARCMGLIAHYLVHAKPPAPGAAFTPKIGLISEGLSTL